MPVDSIPTGNPLEARRRLDSRAFSEVEETPGVGLRTASGEEIGAYSPPPFLSLASPSSTPHRQAFVGAEIGILIVYTLWLAYKCTRLVGTLRHGTRAVAMRFKACILRGRPGAVRWLVPPGLANWRTELLTKRARARFSRSSSHILLPPPLLAGTCPVAPPLVQVVFVTSLCALALYIAGVVLFAYIPEEEEGQSLRVAGKATQSVNHRARLLGWHSG